jgi:hypothetical protein
MLKLILLKIRLFLLAFKYGFAPSCFTPTPSPLKKQDLNLTKVIYFGPFKHRQVLDFNAFIKDIVLFLLLFGNFDDIAHYRPLKVSLRVSLSVNLVDDLSVMY